MVTFDSCNAEPRSSRAVLSVAASLTLAAGALGQTIPGWTLVWQDEFSGTTLNGANWRAENAALIKNNEQQYYSPANVTLAGGFLTILSERRAQGGRPYTSGLIETRNRFSQSFGRFEVRAKLPGTRGLWPAIWMLPQSGIWPPEIDIMELLGHQPTVVYMSHHWGSASAVQSQSNTFTGPDFTADFHVFACEWFPDRVDYFVDGVMRVRHTNTIPRDPMYLIINTAVGGNFPGFPDATTVLPQQMVVDYARVWRRNVVNESFEDLGPAGNQQCFGWTKFGNCFAEPINAHFGARSGKMFGNFTGAGNVSGMYQEMTVQPGQVWRGSSFWFNQLSDRMQGTNRAVLKFEWYSAAGTLLSAVEQTALDASSPTNTFLPVTLQGVAPAGAARLRLILLFTQPALQAGAAFVDDVTLELVPHCSGDFNFDGAVDPDDLGDYITCFFTEPPCVGADFNNDNNTDPDDLGDFITAFFGPC